MGIWSEENSRDALFDAMQRREVFATSGPRITPRLFAGADVPESICDGNFAELGYTHGVPMGGVLDQKLDASPVFAAAVAADALSGRLQRLQIVKVWQDTDGAFQQSVYDIAGNASNGATVDLDDCSVSTVGDTALCTTWRDPAFDPDQLAAWYIRAVENPSCRWSWRQCLSLPSRCAPRVV